MGRRVIVFTRYPEPGRVKTRLIPVLGEQGAANLHRRLTEHTLRWLAPYAESQEVTIEIHLDGTLLSASAVGLSTNFAVIPQAIGDLGERLIAGFGSCREPTIAIGTDCPGLGPEHLSQAFDSLHRRDAVLGPAADGGYYLIGLKEPRPTLFRGIAWGTGEVFRQTRAASQQLDLSVELLETLWDVDRPEDLIALKNEFHGLTIES